MKKLMLVLLLGGFLFTSCQKDDLSSQTELESVDGKGRDKIKSDNGNSEEHCVIDLTPSFTSPANACADAKLGAASYFDLTVNTTDLAGSYAAWCIDQDATLNAGECFDADVFSSYDGTSTPGVVEIPDNFDLVNYMLNRPDIGSFSIGSIQDAIWQLLEGRGCISCGTLGDFSDSGALVADAIANGEGFEPGPDDVLYIVLAPRDGKQSVIIPVNLECEEKGEIGCETAFARGDNGDTCFDQYGFSRWGWTIGPLSEGDYTYDVYAGAGQCDISKGTLVGTVDVSYADGSVDVTYNMSAGFSINEEHTYAGSAPIPTGKNGRPTVAPGQYEIEEGLDGDIHVILHTVVCGEY